MKFMSLYVFQFCARKQNKTVELLQKAISYSSDIYIKETVRHEERKEQSYSKETLTKNSQTGYSCSNVKKNRQKVEQKLDHQDKPIT